MKMDQLIAFYGIFGSCVFGPPQKNFFSAVPRRGSFGRILTMQLEPPKTDACDVRGGDTLYQWQHLDPAELSHCHFHTSGLNLDGTLRHNYPANEWRLVPLKHWNWKWNEQRPDYPTYDQQLLGGMLELSSQSCLLGTDRIVWLCDQEPVETFKKGPSPEKAKLKRWWTYLSQFR